MLNEPSYRPKQLAAVAKVSERTIARWCKLGIIPALQPAGEGGAWIIPTRALKLSRLPDDYKNDILKRIEQDSLA